jgi:hypothetical protein
VSWRGTLLLLVLAAAAAGFLLLNRHTGSRAAGSAILRFDPAETAAIAVIEGESCTVLSRERGVWNLMAPLADRADPNAVSRLLETAASSEALDILPPKDQRDSVSPDALGLKPPKRILIIDDGKKHALKLGTGGAAAGQIYAMVDADPNIYLLKDEISPLAFRPAGEFRDGRLTMLSPEHLEEAALSRSGGLQGLQLRRDRTGWRMEKPLLAAADPEAVTRWITPLLSAKIARWLPESTDPSACGLDSPEAVFTFKEEGGTPLRIMIGSTVPDTPGARFARCENRPGICVLRDMEKAIDVTLASLRSRKLKPVPPDSVDLIRITRGDSTLTLARKAGGGDWICRERDGIIIPETTMQGWFASLADLTATSFEPATPEKIAARRIDRPDAVVRLVARLSENTSEENAGEMILAEYALGLPLGGETALREGSSPDLMILPSEKAALLTELIAKTSGESQPPAEVPSESVH